MSDEHLRTRAGRLTPQQATRVEYAHRDLESARAEDLAQLDPAGLILVIERLRTRLHDTLALIDEMTAPQDQPES
ncbi:hypothetical protein [Streptomyces longwoodensis]|uniref:hypothetical protein n=1 Tax=Streptomyces longwoodensis TaxID=68231 RepID=UPI0036EDFFC7